LGTWGEEGQRRIKEKKRKVSGEEFAGLHNAAMVTDVSLTGDKKRENLRKSQERENGLEGVNDLIVISRDRKPQTRTGTPSREDRP